MRPNPDTSMMMTDTHLGVTCGWTQRRPLREDSGAANATLVRSQVVGHARGMIPPKSARSRASGAGAQTHGDAGHATSSHHQRSPGHAERPTAHRLDGKPKAHRPSCEGSGTYFADPLISDPRQECRGCGPLWLFEKKKKSTLPFSTTSLNF